MDAVVSVLELRDCLTVAYLAIFVSVIVPLFEIVPSDTPPQVMSRAMDAEIFIVFEPSLL